MSSKNESVEETTEVYNAETNFSPNTNNSMAKHLDTSSYVDDQALLADSVFINFSPTDFETVIESVSNFSKNETFDNQMTVSPSIYENRSSMVNSDNMTTLSSSAEELRISELKPSEALGTLSGIEPSNYPVSSLFNPALISTPVIDLSSILVQSNENYQTQKTSSSLNTLDSPMFASSYPNQPNYFKLELQDADQPNVTDIPSEFMTVSQMDMNSQLVSSLSDFSHLTADKFSFSSQHPLSQTQISYSQASVLQGEISQDYQTPNTSNVTENGIYDLMFTSSASGIESSFGTLHNLVPSSDLFIEPTKTFEESTQTASFMLNAGNESNANVTNQIENKTDSFNFEHEMTPCK